MNAQTKVLFFLLLSGLIVQKAVAQDGVGIGTINPHSSAVLEVHPVEGTKGILIPRVPTVDNIDDPIAEGLLVYDSSLQRFCYYNGSIWLTLNEMRNQAGTTAVTHTGNVTVSGTVSATSYGLNATGHGPVPKGGIIMWSGTTVPTGWILCDGTNNTPNLKGRFIVAYHASDTNYDNPGNLSTGGTSQAETGGVASTTLGPTHMPSHTHTATTSSAGAHTHSFTYNGATGKVVGKNSGGGEDGADDAPGTIATTGSAGAHTHAVTVQSSGNANPASFDNRPPYYVLAFIMKL